MKRAGISFMVQWWYYLQGFTVWIYTYIIYLSLQAKKKRKKEKESPSKALPFLAPLLAEMILFSWLSIKDIILLDRRSGSLVFLLFFFSYFCNIFFKIFFCNFLAHSLRQQSPWLFSLFNNIVTASCEGYKHSVWERNTFYETRHLAVRMPRHLALLAGKILEGRERRKGQVTEQHQIRVLTSKGKPYYLIILFWILWFCLGFCDSV